MPVPSARWALDAICRLERPLEAKEFAGQEQAASRILQGLTGHPHDNVLALGVEYGGPYRTYELAGRELAPPSPRLVVCISLTPWVRMSPA